MLREKATILSSERGMPVSAWTRVPAGLGVSARLHLAPEPEAWEAFRPRSRCEEKAGCFPCSGAGEMDASVMRLSVGKRASDPLLGAGSSAEAALQPDPPGPRH